MTEPEKDQPSEQSGTAENQQAQEQAPQAAARPANDGGEPNSAPNSAPKPDSAWAANQPDDAAGEADAAVATPEARVATLEAEVAELKDKLLRAHAEMENVRRRAERDRDDVHKFAVSKFARDLLSVADNLRRALDSAPPEPDEGVASFIAGVEVTERELQGVFERHQVMRIDALGQRFDPNLHEAVFEMEDPARPAGTVVQVMAPGYTIAGRLLRAAMVGVSRGGPREPAQPKLDTSA